MHLTLINERTHPLEVKEKLIERFRIEETVEDVEDAFISLIADNEAEREEAYYKYLETK